MDVFDKIIRENCWKFNKGYPDSQEDINYLKLNKHQFLLMYFTIFYKIFFFFLKFYKKQSIITI